MRHGRNCLKRTKERGRHVSGQSFHCGERGRPQHLYPKKEWPPERQSQGEGWGKTNHATHAMQEDTSQEDQRLGKLEGGPKRQLRSGRPCDTPQTTLGSSSGTDIMPRQGGSRRSCTRRHCCACLRSGVGVIVAGIEPARRGIPERVLGNPVRVLPGEVGGLRGGEGH